MVLTVRYAIYDNDNPAQPVETAPRSEQDGPAEGFVDCIKENRNRRWIWK